MNMKMIFAVLSLTMLATGCGYSSPKGSAPQPGVMPAIADLSPDSMNAGSPAFTLTVDGDNFGAGATVNFNGVRETTTLVTTKQLTAMIPASAIATAGSKPVTVTNPATPGMGGIYGGGGGTTAQTSASTNFTVN